MSVWCGRRIDFLSRSYVLLLPLANCEIPLPFSYVVLSKCRQSCEEICRLFQILRANFEACERKL